MAKTNKNCVNALNGLLSFLRAPTDKTLLEFIGVNALNGLLSFLQTSQ